MHPDSSKMIVCDGFEAGVSSDTYNIDAACRRSDPGGRIDSKSTMFPNSPPANWIRREFAYGELNSPIGEFRNAPRNHSRIESQKLASGILVYKCDSYGHLVAISKQSTNPRSASIVKRKPSNYYQVDVFLGELSYCFPPDPIISIRYAPAAMLQTLIPE